MQPIANLYANQRCIDTKRCIDNKQQTADERGYCDDWGEARQIVNLDVLATARSKSLKNYWATETASDERMI